MSEKVDWSARNQDWSAQWGHQIDPKSMTIVFQSKEESRAIELSQICLPIGPGAHELIRKELREEMSFFTRLCSAVESDTVAEFEKEVIKEEAVKKASFRKAPKKIDLSKIESRKVEEMSYMETSSEEESSFIETCKNCNHLKYVPGQKGLHRCSSN